jgi:hypothetical protein
MRKISAKHVKKAIFPKVNNKVFDALQDIVEDSDDHGLAFCKFIINDLKKQHPSFDIEITDERIFYSLFLGKITKPEEFNDSPKGTLMVYFVAYGIDGSCGIDFMPELPNFIFEYKGIKYKLGQKEPWYYSVEPI